MRVAFGVQHGPGFSVEKAHPFQKKTEMRSFLVGSLMAMNVLASPAITTARGRCFFFFVRLSLESKRSRSSQ